MRSRKSWRTTPRWWRFTSCTTFRTRTSHAPRDAGDRGCHRKPPVERRGDRGVAGANSMNSAEAQEILSRELSQYRDWPYEQLRDLVSLPKGVSRVPGPSGVLYYVDIRVVWDSWWRGTVRVLGAIDDGSGLSPYVPLTDSFIKAPDETFVGED